ncbi:putative Ig domain-containing protein [Lysobacter capsici]|uniref:putative Ig domain-containing protein n=1 Tax=Lysobacter capsici TaxID=435897 RepID=UPI001BFFE661|nr:putative Ig domain-containing protein [Lysobacter capsici]QWF16421.1 putative Ig domain-containing protein [Lysobacter capsici]
MSAVISGNGLGLFNGSASQIGTGLGGGVRLGQGRDNQYVNIATGNLLLQSQDEQLLFRGMSIAAQRTYNSRGLLADVGADAWITGFERRVELLSGTLNAAGSVMRRYTGDGSYQDFAFVSADLYRSTTGDGAHDTLNRDGATSTWTWVEGSTRREEQYANHADATLKGRLTRIRDLKSDGVSAATWNVVYDASNRISEVQAVEGGPQEALIFGYDANGRLSTLSTRINGVVNEQVTYGYDGSGRLSSVLVDLTPADAAGDRDVWDTSNFANNDGYRFHTVYTYVDVSSLQLSQVRQSDGTLVSYTYDAQGRVRTLTRGDVNTDDSDGDGAGQTLTFTYDTADRSTEVADSTGRSWGYVYDAAGQLIEVRSPAVSGVRDLTQYSYDASGNVTRVKAVRGSATLSETVYQYDANGNVLWQWNTVNPASGTAATAVQRTYTASNQLASETVYTGLDADRELGAQAPSGGLTTSYVYDAQDRVRFVIDALGAVHEFEYETVGAGAGQVSKSRQYLGAAYSGVMTLAGLTAWATTAQRAQSTLSESSYDLKGRLSGTKVYAAVDGSGNGVENDATEIVQYQYDAHGQLTQRRALRSSTVAANDGRDIVQTTTYLYDGMGRLLSEVISEKVGAGSDEVRRTTSRWTYQDSGASVRMVIEGGTVNDGVTSNDLLRVEVRDKAGQLISVTDSAFSGGAARTVSKNYYDTAGRLRASEDAGGARSYFFYDEEGQLAAQVDETGAVIEFIRDDLGRVIQTKAYATRVDASTWLTAGKVVPATVAAIRPAATADDRTSTNTYDALGRLLTQKSGSDGATTTHSYDGAGRLLQTTAQDSAGNTRTIRYFYDASGRQTGLLDAEGYLVEHSYDPAGRRIASRAYATVTASAQRAAGTLTQLRPANAAADQLTRWFYDGRGNVVGQLNAEGYLTEFVFDEARNERAVLAYAKQLTGLSGSETLATLHASAITGTLQETRRSYDSLGRLSTERNAEGTVTRYTYDVQGHLVRSETAADTSEVREGRFRYNVFGELIGELGGEGAAHIKAGMIEAQIDAVYAQYGVRHSYDSLGRRIESIDAQGNKVWYFYYGEKQPTYIIKGVANAAGVSNAEGELQKIEYNAFGEISDRYNLKQRLVLATAGSRTAASNAIATLVVDATRDSRQAYRYTNRGQIWRSIDAEGNEARYTYSAFNERIREERAYGTAAASISDYQYDKRGLLTTRADAVGKTEQRSVGSVYDAFGRVTSATDGRGIATTYTYDRLGRQLSRTSRVTYNQATTWTTTYDAYGRSLTTTDPGGAVTTYSYDDASRSMIVIAPGGGRIVTVHNRHGQNVSVTESVTASKAITRTWIYDRDGQLLESHDGLNNIVRNEYDPRGLLNATIDASGRRVELRYDAVGRVLKRIEDPAGLGLTTTYTYDAQGRQLSVTDASGRVSQQRYDRNGRLIEVATDPSGLNLRTTYGYDAQGRQITVTDPGGQVVRYDYDALGRRIAEHIDPAGLNLTTTYVYDKNDNLIRRTDAAGGVTRHVYDEGNQLIYITDPLGAITRQWFDVNGRLISVRTFAVVTDPATLTDGMTVGQMDAKLVWRTDDAHTFSVYDKNGQVRFVLNNIDHTVYGVTEMLYDQASRLVGTRRYATQISTTNDIRQELYAGRLTPEALLALTTMLARNDALDQTEYRVYDDAGRVRLVMNGLGAVIAYGYDADGRVVEEKRYANPVASANLAAAKAAILANTASLATIVSYIPAGQDPVTYRVFDAAGRARYTIDAIGAVTELVLDGAGRTVGSRAYAKTLTLPAALLSKIRGGDKTAQADLAAQIATAALADDARDVRNYQVFDAAGRVRQSIDALGFVRTYGYDAAGRIVSEKQYSKAAALTAALRTRLLAGTATPAELDAVITATSAEDRNVERIYDAGGRLRYELVWSSSSAKTISERRYDAAGRMIEAIAYGITIPVSTASTLGAAATAIAAAGGNSAAKQHQTRYVYDAADQLRFSMDDAGAVTEQRYDGVGRVVETRRYGALIPTATAMTEAAIAAAIAGQTDTRSVRTTYDAVGHVLTVNDALNQVERYVYDALGQVTSYTNKSGNAWTYTYDLAGRRVSETSPDVWIATVDAAGNQSYGVRRVITRTAYDALGNVVTRIENADTAQSRSTRYEYDSRGHQIRTIFPDAGKIDPASGQLIASGIQPTIEIGYDALGRAVVQKDVRGNYSYKVYDALGQLLYDVDAEAYVTRNSYDGFGQKTQLRRHEARLNTAAMAGWSAGQPITLAQIQTAGAVAASGNDRTITTVYDQRGFAVRVEQAQVTYYTAAGNAATGTPTVQVEYDAYGQKVKESVLLEGAAGQPSARWADTYTYYDELGRVVMTVDAEGYVTRTQYNATGEVTETVEFARAVSTIGLTTLAPPNPPPAGDDVSGYDRAIRYGYDALGRKSIQAVVRHFQRNDGSSGVRDVFTQFRYNGENRVTEVIDDTGITKTDYDSLGNAVSVTEPVRAVINDTTFSLLGSGTDRDLTTSWMYEYVSPYTGMIYDAFGNIVLTRRFASGKSAAGAVVEDANKDQIDRIRYDWQGRAVATSNSHGDTSYSDYDAADNVVHRWYILNGAISGRDVRVHGWYSYDKAGRQTGNSQTRDLLNGAGSGTDQSEAVVYNAFGEIVQKTYAGIAGSLNYGYDGAGRLVTSNETFVIKNFGYNLAGHQVRETHVVATSDGQKVDAITWNTTDRLGRTTATRLPSHTADPNATSNIQQRLDRWGNVLEVIDARGYRTNYQYNESNQVVRDERPIVQVVSDTGAVSWVRPVNQWFYDALGRLIGTRDANGNTRSNEYDAAGRLIVTHDALGQTTRFGFDALGNQRITQNPLGYLTYQDYDRLGRVVEIGDYLANGAGGRARAALQRYGLNQNGDRIHVFDALNNLSFYDYDSRHLMLRSQTAMGVVTGYAHDVQGRKIFETNARSGSATITDRDGEAVRVDELAWNYDIHGRLIDHNNLSGRDFDYAYDATTGQITAESQTGGPAAYAIRYTTYYANGLIKALHENGAAPTHRYEYDAAGNRTLEENNTTDAGGKVVHTITRTWYDSNNRVQRVVQDDLSNGAAKRAFDLTYSYDAVGNRRRVQASAGYGADSAEVPAINTAPQLVKSPPPRSVHKGATTEFALVFNEIFLDAQQDPLTLQISLFDGNPLPPWLTARRDAATGQIIFTAQPAANAADQDLGIRLVVSETGNPGNAAATSFTLYVRSNAGPEVFNTAPETIPVKVGTSLTKTLRASDYFYDLDIGDQLRLSIDNLSSLPAWLQIDPATMLLRANPTAVGVFAVMLRATDQNGQSVVKTIHVNAAANSAPTGPSPLPAAVAMRNNDFSWSSPLAQAFTDPDGDSFTVAASGLPAWLSFQRIDNPARPELRLIGQVPGDIPAGTVYTISFTATDTSGATKTTTLAITVRNGNEAPRAPTSFGLSPAAVGYPYSAQLPAFTDPEGDAITYQIAPLPPGLSFDAASRTISGVATTAGEFNVFYTATDQFGASTRMSFFMRSFVNRPPVASSIPNQTTSVGTPFVYEIPRFSDPDGGVIHTATGLPSGMYLSSDGFIEGTASTAGSYTVTVTGSDGYASASTSFVLTVNAVAPPNRAPQRNYTPQDVYIEVSESTGVSGGTGWPADAFIDADGNPLTYQLVNSPAWVEYGYGRGGFAGHQFDFFPPGQTKTYTVTVRATDSFGAFADMSFTVRVFYRAGGGVPLSQPGGPAESSLSFDMAPESESAGTATAASTMASTPTPIDVRDYWFTYDAENRIAINNGRLVNGQIVLAAQGGDSYQLGYDAAGHAVTRTFYRGNDLKVQRSDFDLRGNRTVEFQEQYGGGSYYGGIERVFSYDANNRQLGSRSYIAAGETYTYTSRPGEIHEEYETYDIGGWLSQAENFAYDADGRLIYQEHWTRNGDLANWVRQAARNNENGRQATDTSVLNVRKSRVDYLDSNNQSTYDVTGKAWSYRTFAPGYTHTYTVTYEGWESYQEKSVSGVSTDNNYKPTTNTLTYDAYGRLISQVENTRLKNGTLDDRVRYYAYNGDGQVQTRREGTLNNGQFTQTGTTKPNYLFAYAGGQQMAQVREGERGIVSLNGMGMYEAGGGKVSALAGETLRDLARRVYGNEQQWYVLAQANGLGDPDQEIGGGLQLEAPNVDVSRNDAGTFKPYNPSEAIGSTTPSLPHIPPPKAACSSVAKVIVLVIVVAVAVFTGGTILAALPTAGTLGLGTAMFIGGVAGAAGALAGQAAGSFMGISSFSWRAVAAGAITGAITGGIAEIAGGAAAGFGSTVDGAEQAVSATAGFGRVAAQAIGNPLAAYAGDKIAGLDTSFSWRNIVAGTFTNLVASYAGPAISDRLKLNSNFSRSFTEGMTAGVVSAATRNVMGIGDGFDLRSIVSDAFGNALGNLIGNAIGGTENQAIDRARGNVTNSNDNSVVSVSVPARQQNVDGIATLDTVTATIDGSAWQFWARNIHSKSIVNVTHGGTFDQDGEHYDVRVPERIKIESSSRYKATDDMPWYDRPIYDVANGAARTVLDRVAPGITYLHDHKNTITDATRGGTAIGLVKAATHALVDILGTFEGTTPFGFISGGQRPLTDTLHQKIPEYEDDERVGAAIFGVGSTARNLIRGSALRDFAASSAESLATNESPVESDASEPLYEDQTSSSGISQTVEIDGSRANETPYSHLSLSMRHFYGKFTKPNRSGNSIFLGPRQAAYDDLAEIRAGLATKKGEFFYTSSGRVWGTHSGTTTIHPVSGDNIVNVTSQEYNALVIYQREGKDTALNYISRLDDGVKLTYENARRVRWIIGALESEKSGDINIYKLRDHKF